MVLDMVVNKADMASTFMEVTFQVDKEPSLYISSDRFEVALVCRDDDIIQDQKNLSKTAGRTQGCLGYFLLFPDNFSAPGWAAVSKCFHWKTYPFMLQLLYFLFNYPHQNV